MKPRKKEHKKDTIEEKGLKLECGQMVYRIGAGSIEEQPNYNKYFGYLKCPSCRRIYYL